MYLCVCVSCVYMDFRKLILKMVNVYNIPTRFMRDKKNCLLIFHSVVRLVREHFSIASEKNKITTKTTNHQFHFNRIEFIPSRRLLWFIHTIIIHNLIFFSLKITKAMQKKKTIAEEREEKKKKMNQSLH